MSMNEEGKLDWEIVRIILGYGCNLAVVSIQVKLKARASIEAKAPLQHSTLRFAGLLDRKMLIIRTNLLAR
jgi:hypothetical protein